MESFHVLAAQLDEAMKLLHGFLALDDDTNADEEMDVWRAARELVEGYLGKEDCCWPRGSRTQGGWTSSH